MNDVQNRSPRKEARPRGACTRAVGVAHAVPARGRGAVIRLILGFVIVMAGSATCARRQPAARQPNQPRPDRFIETVRARAPFDLSCSAEQVTIIQLGETTLGARGCGRQTSYACVCTYHVWSTCTQAVCSLDGAATASPAPDPAATPSPPPPAASTAPPARGS